jgi:GNAT superfamily N-acetyltransferase
MRPAKSDPPAPIAPDQLRIVPANEASWDDLQAIFGTTDYPGKCHCQWYKIRDSQWRTVPDAERADRLREQTACGNPDAPATTGLVAYLDDEPVGWCAIEPRTAYPRLLKTRTPWTGRDEDKTDPTVWSVTCFVTRRGFRKRGITYALARATVDFARTHGARALEAYTMITHPDKEITWGELHVGSRDVLAAAGFTEVSHPTPRRVVMRIDF